MVSKLSRPPGTAPAFSFLKRLLKNNEIDQLIASLRAQISEHEKSHAESCQRNAVLEQELAEAGATLQSFHATFKQQEDDKRLAQTTFAKQQQLLKTTKQQEHDLQQAKYDLEQQNNVLLEQCRDLQQQNQAYEQKITEINALLHAGNTALKETNGRCLQTEQKLVDANNLVNSATAANTKLTKVAAKQEYIIAKSTNEIFVFSTTDLHFIEANRQAQNSLGYTMTELEKLTFLDTASEFTPLDFANHIKPLYQDAGEPAILETIHKRKDGTLYPVLVHIFLVQIEEPPVFIAIANDLTERNKMQGKLLNYQAKLFKWIKHQEKELELLK